MEEAKEAAVRSKDSEVVRIGDAAGIARLNGVVAGLKGDGGALVAVMRFRREWEGCTAFGGVIAGTRDAASLRTVSV